MRAPRSHWLRHAVLAAAIAAPLLVRAQDSTVVPVVPAAVADTTPVAAPVAFAGPIPGLPDSLAGATFVSYVVGSSVYISAGGSDKLAMTSRVVVVRDTVIIAELKVNYLSSHSGACEVIAQTDSVREGDLVRFSLAPAAVAAQPFTPIGAPVTPMRALGVRGLVGVELPGGGADRRWRREDDAAGAAAAGRRKSGGGDAALLQH